MDIALVKGKGKKEIDIQRKTFILPLSRTGAT